MLLPKNKKNFLKLHFNRERIQDQYEDLHQAFAKFDSRKRGFLTANDFQKILLEHSFYLDDDQLFDLMDGYVECVLEI